MASSSSSSLFSLLLLLVLSFSSSFSSAPDGDLVTILPGFDGTFPSKHYAGYVTIDESHGRNLFYYFVVSEENPSKDPVVLWLNGGPGCSSFDGFVYEHGPFNFEVEGAPDALPKLHLNPYSWSKVSNIIYLDSPAGVGLSYSNDTSDYCTGDLKTASDAHTFLLKWFDLYPEFLKNPFYIAGESYAGIYVPTLSAEVANGIKAGVKPELNFKGYMVGNGCTDEKFDGDALVPFAHGMGLISNDLFQEVNDACKGSYWNPLNQNCQDKLEKVDWELNNINVYDILEPCYHRPEIKYPLADNSRLPASFRMLGETDKPLPVRKRMFGRSWPFKAPVKAGRVPTWPELGSSSVPCTIMDSEKEFTSGAFFSKPQDSSRIFPKGMSNVKIGFSPEKENEPALLSCLGQEKFTALPQTGEADIRGEKSRDDPAPVTQASPAAQSTRLGDLIGWSRSATTSLTEPSEELIN